MIVPFDTLPDPARLWIYTASEPIAEAAEPLSRGAKEFVATWMSHGRPVAGDAFVCENRFLILGALGTEEELSGCGIDASVHEVVRLGERLGIHWADALSVAYRSSPGMIEVVERSVFRARSRSGEVDADTVVFDTALPTVGDWRSSRFERAAADSWHARVFGLARAA